MILSTKKSGMEQNLTEHNLNKKKLLELSEKAVVIEEAILKEEKCYQQALSQGSNAFFLISIRDKIKELGRKGSLFNGAIKTRLKNYIDC
jgi:hypothetical protein